MQSKVKFLCSSNALLQIFLSATLFSNCKKKLSIDMSYLSSSAHQSTCKALPGHLNSAQQQRVTQGSHSHAHAAPSSSHQAIGHRARHWQRQRANTRHWRVLQPPHCASHGVQEASNQQHVMSVFVTDEAGLINEVSQIFLSAGEFHLMLMIPDT